MTNSHIGSQNKQPVFSSDYFARILNMPSQNDYNGHFVNALYFILDSTKL